MLASEPVLSVVVRCEEKPAAIRSTTFEFDRISLASRMLQKTNNILINVRQTG